MKLAFVFPGQGSQYVGMGQALAQEYPAARAALDESDAATGGGLLKLMSDGPEEELRKTANTQPAILAVSVAVHRVLVKEAGGRFQLPAFYAGHSLGEYSALVAAGALSLRDAVRAVRARGTFMISKAKGAKRAVPLPVSAPFHCSLMSPVQPRLAEVLGTVQLKMPNAPVIANATAEPNTDPARILPLLLSQVTSPVRWVETVQKMVLNGVDTILELGPGKVLSGLARRIDKGVRAYSVEDPAGLSVVLREVFQ